MRDCRRWILVVEMRFLYVGIRWLSFVRVVLLVWERFVLKEL